MRLALLLHRPEAARELPLAHRRAEERRLRPPGRRRAARRGRRPPPRRSLALALAAARTAALGDCKPSPRDRLAGCAPMSCTTRHPRRRGESAGELCIHVMHNSPFVAAGGGG